MSPETTSVGEERDGQPMERNQRQTSSTWSFASVTISNSSGGRITGLKGVLILTCSWHSKARPVQGCKLHARRHGIISHEANSILQFALTVQKVIYPLLMIWLRFYNMPLPSL